MYYLSYTLDDAYVSRGVSIYSNSNCWRVIAYNSFTSLILR
nr:MAG TPA: hypothetical protein [Caudoviricetes sp.]